MLSSKIKLFVVMGVENYLITFLVLSFQHMEFLTKNLVPTPQQNGVVARKHRHIVEMALTIMIHSSLPINFWLFAFSIAVYLINRLPSLYLNKNSSFELLFHTSSDYALLKVFSCSCYPLHKPYTSHKLQPKTTRCVFLSYSSNSKGYLSYNTRNRRLFTTHHVIFDETNFSFASSLPISSFHSQSSSPTSYSLSYTLFIQPSTSCPVLPTTLSHFDHTNDFYLLSSPSDAAPTQSSGDIPHNVDTTAIVQTNIDLPDLVSIPPLAIAQSVPTVTEQPQVTNSHTIQTRNKSEISKRRVFVGHTSLSDNCEPSYYTQDFRLQVRKTTMTEEYDSFLRQGTCAPTLIPQGKQAI